MKQQILARTAILATAIVTLAGCDDFRSALGMDRHVPDETQVVSRPALTLPPDYNLRPPGTATPVSGEHESGSTMGQATGTQGEQSLENSAAAGTAAPQEERGFFGRIADFFDDVLGDSSTPMTAQPSAPASDAPAQPSSQPSTAPAPTPSQSVNGVPDANGK